MLFRGVSPIPATLKLSSFATLSFFLATFHFETFAHQSVISSFAWIELADSFGTRHNHYWISPLYLCQLFISSPLLFCLRASWQSDPSIFSAPKLQNSNTFYGELAGCISLFSSLMQMNKTCLTFITKAQHCWNFHFTSLLTIIS